MHKSFSENRCRVYGAFACYAALVQSAVGFLLHFQAQIGDSRRHDPNIPHLQYMYFAGSLKTHYVSILTILRTSDPAPLLKPSRR